MSEGDNGATAPRPIALLAWPDNWYWYLTLILVFVYLPLLFPTGHLLSSRWRIVAWLGAVGVGGTAALGAVAAEIGFQGTQNADGVGESIPNPLGIDGLAHVEQLTAVEDTVAPLDVTVWLHRKVAG